MLTIQDETAVPELPKLTAQFRRLLEACPKEYNPRQRVLVEMRNRCAFVAITSTFKVPLSSANGKHDAL